MPLPSLILQSMTTCDVVHQPHHIFNQDTPAMHRPIKLRSGECEECYRCTIRLARESHPQLLWKHDDSIAFTEISCSHHSPQPSPRYRLHCHVPLRTHNAHFRRSRCQTRHTARSSIYLYIFTGATTPGYKPCLHACGPSPPASSPGTWGLSSPRPRRPHTRRPARPEPPSRPPWRAGRVEETLKSSGARGAGVTPGTRARISPARATPQRSTSLARGSCPARPSSGGGGAAARARGRPPMSELSAGAPQPVRNGALLASPHFIYKYKPYCYVGVVLVRLGRPPGGLHHARQGGRPTVTMLLQVVPTVYNRVNQ